MSSPARTTKRSANQPAELCAVHHVGLLQEAGLVQAFHRRAPFGQEVNMSFPNTREQEFVHDRARVGNVGQ
jgi:hypothetical protein